MNAKKNLWVFICLLIFFCVPILGTADAGDVERKIKAITVVIDDNYPPYIFRDPNGDIQGILVDEWKLWGEKTNIKVNLIAMDWAKAQDWLLNGKADVIDTLFITEERAKQYNFTKPYATIEVPIFYHKNLSGIVDISSLHGFSIGVKAGDSCVEILNREGINNLQEYNSYESIVHAAVDGQIKVFSIDKPPAFYYLYKMNFENEFRQAFTLYSGQFHRAVKKGRIKLLKVVENGFAQISEREHNEINKKWMGKPLSRPGYLRYILFSFLIAGLLFLALIFFNFTLRKKIRLKTSELQDLVDRLQQSEERFRSIFDQAAVGVALCDSMSGNYVSVNDKYCDITGYSHPEIRRLTFQDITHPDDLQDDLDKRKLILEGKIEDFTIEKRYIRKDESVIWIKITVSPIQTHSDDVKLHIAIVEDITEQKKAQDAICESEAKYKELADSLPQVVFEMDVNGNITFANHNACDLFGYTKEDFYKGLNAIQIFIPEDRGRALKNIQKTLDGCLLGGVEYTAVQKNGSTFPVMIHANRYMIDNKPAGLNGLIIDLTERKRAEKEKADLEARLQQVQKMEAIGTLAGGIAHDLNNILFPIFGYLEMVLEDVLEDNPLHGKLTEVLNGAFRARDLVKQILTFSRQSELERKPLKMQLVIKEVLKLIRSTLPTTIEIHQDISNKCESIMADPTQIHQIVMNLITNSYHAMEDTGGTLKVIQKEVELTIENVKGTDMVPGPYACLTVSDTGTGIEQRIIARIFDPYFTTKKEGKGTGLGLAVVHGIVKSHGGDISVYSEPGIGTEIKVYLPVIKPKKVSKKNETDLPIQRGTERILLVDDQDVIAQMIRQLLERLGYHVTVRTSSLEALEAFRAQPEKFDLVITDMTMPNMTGDKLAGELIKIRYDIPVILCTGFSEGMSEERAASLGIKGFLLKPVVMKDLSGAIRKVLDKPFAWPAPTPTKGSATRCVL